MRLGINIDHVATLRQARMGSYPDPVAAAQICQKAGATSIVCHLREDRRHIHDKDVVNIIRGVDIPVNLEMSTAEDVIESALKAKPHQVTFVPERREELTTEGGLNVHGQEKKLRYALARFKDSGIHVSLFIDPDSKQLLASKNVGADIIELHTGTFANQTDPVSRVRELRAIENASFEAKKIGLAVAAGHGLDMDNVLDIALIKEIEELNIGFSIIARSVFIGLESAVKEMRLKLSETSAVSPCA